MAAAAAEDARGLGEERANPLPVPVPDPDLYPSHAHVHHAYQASAFDHVLRVVIAATVVDGRWMAEA